MENNLKMSSTSLTTNIIHGLLLLLVKKSIVTEKEMVSLLCESVEFTAKEQEKQAREELKKEFGGLN